MMSEDPHSAEDHGVHGYMGYLNRNSVTIAEVLKEAGYHTYMSGKWHVGMHGQEKWPLQRGFDHFMVSCQELAVICNLMEIAI